MEDDILKDEEDELDLKPPHNVEKEDGLLDEEPESLDELAEEEDEEEEPYDDVNPI